MIAIKKTIKACGIFLIATFSSTYSSNLQPRISLDGAAIEFARTWDMDDFSRELDHILKIYPRFAIEKYVDKYEIPLAFPYCVTPENFENDFFVQEASWIIITKAERALTTPLQPCILILVSYPPYESCLVMHLHFQNRLQDALKVITCYVPDSLRNQAKISMFSVVSEDRFFRNQECIQISQTEVVGILQEELKSEGFCQQLITPVCIDDAPDWSAVLLYSFFPYVNAQKSAFVSYDYVERAWKINTICLLTELFLKQYPNFPYMGSFDYNLALKKYADFRSIVQKISAQDFAFSSTHSYVLLSQKEPVTIKTFMNCL